MVGKMEGAHDGRASMIGFCLGSGTGVRDRSRAVRMCAVDPVAREESRLQKLKEKRALSTVDVPPFERKMAQEGLPELRKLKLETLQINIGLTCNMACTHCHVESSPSRKETMSRTVAERLVKLTEDNSSIKTVDITGGAPEMHEQFEFLVDSFRTRGLSVIDRCNLSILELQPNTAEYLAKSGVKVVASLPCYTAENVEAQRGDGIFDASIRALQRLNELGYGIAGSGLELDLVYNPGGAFLPPPQAKLEEDYRRELRKAFGIEFNHLIAITNMPIKRFADDLRRQNKITEYMELLVDKFNPSTVDNLMCNHQIHVAYDGRIYDCDFNYALEMPVPLRADMKKDRPSFLPDSMTIFDVDSWDELNSAKIATARHCYGCTAGSGSSCGGSLS